MSLALAAVAGLDFLVFVFFGDLDALPNPVLLTGVVFLVFLTGEGDLLSSDLFLLSLILLGEGSRYLGRTDPFLYSFLKSGDGGFSLLSRGYWSEDICPRVAQLPVKSIGLFNILFLCCVPDYVVFLACIHL